MVTHPLQPVPLDPKPDQRKPHEQRLALETPRAALVRCDEVRLGMQIGNLIWAAVHGTRERK